MAPPMTNIKLGSQVPVISKKLTTFDGFAIPLITSPVPKRLQRKHRRLEQLGFFVAHRLLRTPPTMGLETVISPVDTVSPTPVGVDRCEKRLSICTLAQVSVRTPDIINVHTNTRDLGDFLLKPQTQTLVQPCWRFAPAPTRIPPISSFVRSIEGIWVKPNRLHKSQIVPTQL